jgi:hypothetical protein
MKRMNNKKLIKKALEEMDLFLKELELSGYNIFPWLGKGLGRNPFVSIAGSGGNPSFGVKASNNHLVVSYQLPIIRGRLTKKFKTTDELMDWIAKTLREYE